MSVSIELLSTKNPNPNPRLSFGSEALYGSPCMRVQSRAQRVSIAPRAKVAAKGIGVGFQLPERRRSSFYRSTVVFSASHEESSSEESSEIKATAKESEEAWKQTLAAFREQAIKMQSVSQEAYEIYSKRATAILTETAEQLKIEAEKARKDLTVVAKELSEDGKKYLTEATENNPEVKEIVETFTLPTEDVKEFSTLRDFYLGIPYGLLLTVGGFISFMVTGSIPAIRFGIILGGALLALSIASLRSHKKGKTSPVALKGQAGQRVVYFTIEITKKY
ncbi:protein fatty acid export 3 [Citrus sinensis]|uniref:Protein fatty acid export 3 n=1 Tax=Citrus sinensis TaxID=2711 RepID=A0ACB8JX41_CITSI|nr:protein fatty acid export 3 [Citrus sinensis]